jgi:cAMP-dependent protein kinase regulator
MFSSIRKFAGGGVIVRKGEPGKSLYLIVEGHVTASVTVGGKKETLAEIGEGDFFGELALFTRMPRSADVYADLPTVTLVLDFDTLELMARELPELSSVILIRMGKVLALRILEDNKRYQKRISSEFLWV